MSTFTDFSQFAALAGLEEDSDVDDWFLSSQKIVREFDLERLAKAVRWMDHIKELNSMPQDRWPERVLSLGLIAHKDSSVLTHLLNTHRWGSTEFLAEILWRSEAFDHVAHSAGSLPRRLVNSTETMISFLETLRSGFAPTSELIQEFPELEGLCLVGAAYVEHEVSTSGAIRMPLLEHLVDRTLSRKLLGLERESIQRFQIDDALSPEAFQAEVAVVKRLEAAKLMPLVRAAFLFLDFTKGGTQKLRETWSSYGADLSIHNEAAATVVEQAGVLQRFPEFRQNTLCAEIILQLIAHHGLTGQAIRGETPLGAFEGLGAFLQEKRSDMASSFRFSELDAVDAVVDMLHVLNVCDTAGVREGLFDDVLRFEMVAVESLIRRVGKKTNADISYQLADFGDRDDTSPEGLVARHKWLWDRLCRLRRLRASQGESPRIIKEAVEQLEPDAIHSLVSSFAHCQLWYFEVATSCLSPMSQLKLLALALNAAKQKPDLRFDQTFHVSFEPMVAVLEQISKTPSNRYRLLLLEAILRPIDINEAVRGEVSLGEAQHILGFLDASIGGVTGVSIRFQTNEEAEALITLLSTYERRSSAAFHSTLKALCDLYGLRKDTFDRLSNETQYLETMNAARTDKERMLDYVKPGVVLEIGPGGGVVLDLLEERYPESDVVGVDLSSMVIQELEEKKTLEGRQWSLLEADAFELADHFAANSVDTVIFCSVLHEIYSYVEFPIGAETRRFRLEAIRDMIRASFRVLKPGGRIVIRDGIMPPDETRVIEFIDPEGPAFFELFQDQFEGRTIRGEWMDETHLKISAPDAMEFLYCYTWGPASFPYEVREQYGVLPYDEYTDTLVTWLDGLDGHSASLVEIPAPMRSYLQPGYPRALSGKIQLLNSRAQEVPLPDSNCLIVIEKG